MTPEQSILPGTKSVEDLIDVFTDGTKRVQRFEVNGGVVWLKRYGTEKAPVWVKIQNLLSRFIPINFLRPSPILSPEGMAEREESTIDMFAQAGFDVPRVLCRRGNLLVLTDNGPTVKAKLKETYLSNPGLHDALLIRCAGDLGRAHAAGLCHGRPHPRDFTLHAGTIGFLDFEEEPTRVMPIAVAQARDIWLLFINIGQLALRDGTLEAAFRAWAQVAPKQSVQELIRMTRIVRPLLFVAKALNTLKRSSDVQRFVTASIFLNSIDPDRLPLH